MRVEGTIWVALGGDERTKVPTPHTTFDWDRMENRIKKLEEAMTLSMEYWINSEKAFTVLKDALHSAD